MIEFLKTFEEPCPVAVASSILFGSDDKLNCHDPRIPPLVYQALEKGFVESFLPGAIIAKPDESTSKGIPKIFFAELILTESGRAACGLPPLVKVAPVPVEKLSKSKQKTPRQQTKSLFDD